MFSFSKDDSELKCSGRGVFPSYVAGNFLPGKGGMKGTNETGVCAQIIPGKVIAKETDYVRSLSCTPVHASQHPTHPCKYTSGHRESASFMTKDIEAMALVKPFLQGISNPLLVNLFSCLPPRCSWLSLQTEFPSPQQTFLRAFCQDANRHPQLLGPNLSP